MSGWPYSLNQLAGRAGPRDEDGRPDDTWNDCGPASVAAVCRWLLGWQDLEPDAVRDWMYGDGRTGYTYLEDLNRFLQEYAGVSTTLVKGAGDPAAWVRAYVGQGRPILAVTKEPAGYFHICPYTGMDGKGVIRHQVLGGYRETLTWAEFGARAAFSGWLLGINRAKVAP